MGHTPKQLRCKTQVRHVTWESFADKIDSVGGLMAKRQPEVAWRGDSKLRGTDHKQPSCRGNRSASVHRRLQMIARPEEHGNKSLASPCVTPAVSVYVALGRPGLATRRHGCPEPVVSVARPGA